MHIGRGILRLEAVDPAPPQLDPVPPWPDPVPRADLAGEQPARAAVCGGGDNVQWEPMDGFAWTAPMGVEGRLQ